VQPARDRPGRAVVVHSPPPLRCSRVDLVERDWDVLAGRLSADAIAAGRPTGWFDDLYSAGERGEVSMPWDRDEPHPLLRDWAERERVDGSGSTAVVVGCGLGADAEYLAGLGFATTGFDLAPTAVRLAAQRHPGSAVRYEVADLFALPAAWLGAFDLVVEVFTLQAMPDPPRDRAIAGVRSLVAPGGALVAIQFRYDGREPLDAGPPFPQPRELFDRLAGDDLVLESVEELEANGPRWRAVLSRA